MTEKLVGNYNPIQEKTNFCHIEVIVVSAGSIVTLLSLCLNKLNLYFYQKRKNIFVLDDKKTNRLLHNIRCFLWLICLVDNKKKI